ncbi:TPA: acyltransferase [Stenotrophomonas maltophilia]|nr:acyltransferase [Stenotrophomonas maltophilia]HDS1155680.1 acyltransferase [Stenotrophomonas maltophilia]HDS1164309.1 acyltransferase [Stenotrophomonas maltophilia]HDS1170226.1 acyltransferase [Stenotrophomonas maltophilia]HDS1176044.1 acyltransferase [Stenotrophomonas maltophilia]
MRYNPALDGLRAIAVILVLAFHARLFGGFGGFFGVDVFFVLSGYLITRILAEQHAATGSLRVGAFYVRRLRRLYPALLLLLAVYLAVAPWAFPERTGHLRDAVVAGLYLSDYGFAFWRVPWYLQHTWSLAVEEHFYLAWPLALLAVFRLPQRWWATSVLLLAVAATLWRWHVTLNDDAWYQPYYRFDTRLSGILLGAAAGLFNPAVPKAAAPLGAFLLAAAVTQAHVKELTALTTWMLLAEIGALLLVLSAQHVRALSWRPLVWLGKLSYGIYLWHYPIMYWFRGHEITGWRSMVLGSAAAVLCAAVSYYTVERFSRSGRAEGIETSRAGQVRALGRDPGIR